VFNVTPLLAIYFVMVTFLVGSLLGLLTIAARYRRRPDGRLILRAGWSGLAFLVAILIASWADSHVVVRSGPKIVVGLHGENLRLESFVANHGLLVAVTGSVVVALLAGLGLGRQTPH
jgi:hypothetical protein